MQGPSFHPSPLSQSPLTTVQQQGGIFSPLAQRHLLSVRRGNLDQYVVMRSQTVLMCQTGVAWAKVVLEEWLEG